MAAGCWLATSNDSPGCRPSLAHRIRISFDSVLLPLGQELCASSITNHTFCVSAGSPSACRWGASRAPELPRMPARPDKHRCAGGLRVSPGQQRRPLERQDDADDIRNPVKGLWVHLLAAEFLNGCGDALLAGGLDSDRRVVAAITVDG